MAASRQMPTAAVAVSVVVPVLNDAAALQNLLAHLQLPGDGRAEVIVADGGSTDGSSAVASAAGCRVVECAAGRGHQLATGIETARGSWLWMLHADSEPSVAALAHLLGRDPQLPAWGRFRVSLDPGTPLEIVAAAMNWRSWVTGICTGDQGIFVHQRLLAHIGGMPRQSLMEDIELCKRLRRLRRPECRYETVRTSPRRWRQGGAVRTVLTMWRFRLRYWRGVDAEVLAREYYGS